MLKSSQGDDPKTFCFDLCVIINVPWWNGDTNTLSVSYARPEHSIKSILWLWYDKVVNHVRRPPPQAGRLTDGRLGLSLPALWVCLRQMGLCIHLLAPCLPTVRSAQLSDGAHATRLDTAGTFLVSSGFPPPHEMLIVVVRRQHPIDSRSRTRFS